VALIEELVGFMRRHRSVWFTTCDEVARWHEQHGRAGASATRRPRRARLTRALTVRGERG
jgi:hypothetical protein